MLGFLLAACVVGVGLAYLVERQTRLSYVLTTSLDEASIRDPLTGLHNRRWLEVILEQLTSAFQRYGTPFSLILFDLDGFKAVNDQFGYTQGDGLLRRFSEALTGQLRKADIIFRYGGDEFIILAAVDRRVGRSVLRRPAQELHSDAESERIRVIAVARIQCRYGRGEWGRRRCR